MSSETVFCRKGYIYKTQTMIIAIDMLMWKERKPHGSLL